MIVDNCVHVVFGRCRMEGLQCLGPTEMQCHQMQVECTCPLNSQLIESCTPKPEGVYRLDGETLRCMTCDEFLDGMADFSAGDFGCRIGSLATDHDDDDDGTLDVWEVDCLPGDVGAVSGAPCPHLTALELELESFIDTDQEINCGAHGTLVDGSCQCNEGANGLKCWQTNRERSYCYCYLPK